MKATEHHITTAPEHDPAAGLMAAIPVASCIGGPRGGWYTSRPYHQAWKRNMPDDCSNHTHNPAALPSPDDRLRICVARPDQAEDQGRPELHLHDDRLRCCGRRSQSDIMPANLSQLLPTGQEELIFEGEDFRRPVLRQLSKLPSSFVRGRLRSRRGPISSAP